MLLSLPEPVSTIEVKGADGNGSDMVDSDSWISFNICSQLRCCSAPKLRNIQLNNGLVIDLTSGYDRTYSERKIFRDQMKFRRRIYPISQGQKADMNHHWTVFRRNLYIIFRHQALTASFPASQVPARRWNSSSMTDPGIHFSMWTSSILGVTMQP